MHLFIYVSVVVKTSSLESESRPERLDNLRLGLKPDLKISLMLCKIFGDNNKIGTILKQ